MEDVAAGAAELRRSGPQADDAEGAGRDDNLSNPNDLFQQRNLPSGRRMETSGNMAFMWMGPAGEWA